MIDISTLNPLFIQIPIFALLIFGFISGFRHGIIKKLFDLVIYIVLIGIMIFAVPPLAAKLEATGFIQNFIASKMTGEFATVVTGLLTRPIYIVITGALIFLAYFIIKFFVGIIHKFSHKSMLNRVFGAIWQVGMNFIFCAFLMIIIASPSIFKGGHELLTNTKGVNTLYSGVVKIQETLKNRDLPYNLESVFSKVLATNGSSVEDIKRIQSTLERMPTIIDSINNGTIVSDMVDSNGNINQQKANELIDDMIVFSQLVNKLPENQQQAIKDPINKQLVEGSKALETIDGTIIVTQEQKDSFNKILGQEGLNVDPSVIAIYEQKLTVK